MAWRGQATLLFLICVLGTLGTRKVWGAFWTLGSTQSGNWGIFLRTGLAVSFRTTCWVPGVVAEGLRGDSGVVDEVGELQWSEKRGNAVLHGGQGLPDGGLEQSQRR